MKNQKILISFLVFAVIVSCGLFVNKILASDEYQISLSQYQDERSINPLFTEGNKALFGKELKPGTDDIKLDLSVKINKGIIHRNTNVEGIGNLVINGINYPIVLTDGDLENIKTKDGNKLLFGPADGYIEINDKKVELVMTFSIMPESKNKLISITFSTPGKGIPALVFGEPFDESTDYLTKIKQES